MAAGYLPTVGDENGPCADTDCEHDECDFVRTSRATLCKHCNEPIESRPFYNIPPEDGPTWNGDLVHAVCAEEAVEDERDNERTA